MFPHSLNLFPHSPIYSLILLFIHSFSYLFPHSLIYSFILIFIPSFFFLLCALFIILPSFSLFIPSFIYSLIYLFSRSLICSLILLFVPSFSYLLSHFFICSLILLFVRSLSYPLLLSYAALLPLNLVLLLPQNHFGSITFNEFILTMSSKGELIKRLCNKVGYDFTNGNFNKYTTTDKFQNKLHYSRTISQQNTY